MNSSAVESLAGAAGAVGSLIVTYPLLTICTRQAVNFDTGRSEEKKFQGLSKRIQECFHELDVPSLYRGVTPAIIGTLISQGIYFYFYAELRELFAGGKKRLLAAKGTSSRERAQLSVVESLLVAAGAGCGNVILTNPIWVATTRMQTAAKLSRPTSVTSELKELYSEGGLAALWRGVLPSLVMVVNPTIQYMLYEWSVNTWLRRRSLSGDLHQPLSISTLPASHIFALSAFSKVAATLATYPLLVVKNRIQAVQQSQRKDGIVRTLSAILREDGIFGLFKGLRTKILQSVLAAALMLVLKERLHTAAARLFLSSASA